MDIGALRPEKKEKTNMKHLVLSHVTTLLIVRASEQNRSSDIISSEACALWGGGTAWSREQGFSFAAWNIKNVIGKGILFCIRPDSRKVPDVWLCVSIWLSTKNTIYSSLLTHKNNTSHKELQRLLSLLRLTVAKPSLLDRGGLAHQFFVKSKISLWKMWETFA